MCAVGLKNPAANPRFQTFSDYLLGVYVGEHQYSLLRIAPQDLARRIDTVQPWHANVQNNKVWFQLPAFLHGIASVSSLSTDLPSFVRSKQRTYSEKKNGMVIS